VRLEVLPRFVRLGVFLRFVRLGVRPSFTRLVVFLRFGEVMTYAMRFAFVFPDSGSGASCGWWYSSVQS
jgi:hypothetical protein